MDVMHQEDLHAEALWRPDGLRTGTKERRFFSPADLNKEVTHCMRQQKVEVSSLKSEFSR